MSGLLVGVFIIGLVFGWLLYPILETEYLAQQRQREYEQQKGRDA